MNRNLQVTLALGMFALLGTVNAAHAQSYVFDSNIGNGFGTGNGQFNNPQGVAVDSSGNLFVSDFGNNRIVKFRPSAVPEPGLTVSFLCGLAGVGVCLYRKRRQ